MGRSVYGTSVRFTRKTLILREGSVTLTHWAGSAVVQPPSGAGPNAQRLKIPD